MIFQNPLADLFESSRYQYTMQPHLQEKFLKKFVGSLLWWQTQNEETRSWTVPCRRPQNQLIETVLDVRTPLECDCRVQQEAADAHVVVISKFTPDGIGPFEIIVSEHLKTLFSVLKFHWIGFWWNESKDQVSHVIGKIILLGFN